MLVQGALKLLGIRVDGFDTKVGNIVFHCETSSAFNLVPVKVYSIIHIAFPIICDVVVFLEYILDIVGMSFIHVFDPEVIYN